jgi:CRISPR system Cascade subunit CasE
MYFSLITPTPGREREAAHEWVSGAYAEHQWLWRFFPSVDGSPRDFLFRRRDLDDFPRFYVVSKRPPQAHGGAWRLHTRDYAPMLAVGVPLSFELRANPVIARSTDGKGKRHDVVMDRKLHLLRARGLSRWEDWKDDRVSEDGQLDPKPALYELVQSTCTEWLKKRSENCGFALDESSLVVDAYQQHRGKKGQLSFSTVDFTGQLTVTDPSVFARTLEDGVGRAKAFGCGLLLVKPTVRG